MHTFRLLDMAIEIANENQVNVHRPNREFLLSIKRGEYEYQDLIKLANQKQSEMVAAFASSNIQQKPNIELINNLLVKYRQEIYSNNNS